jgi:UDP-glucose 4-epimerase
LGVRWRPFVEGDLRDDALVRRVLHDYDIGAVVHFGAHAYVGESIVNPQKSFDTNVVGSLTLLDTLLTAGISRIVFSSTCATYGIPDEVPIPEEHPQRPINPYGESKLMVERVLRTYGDA